MRISDWSSDVCSSDLRSVVAFAQAERGRQRRCRGEYVGIGREDPLRAQQIEDRVEFAPWQPIGYKRWRGADLPAGKGDFIKRITVRQADRDDIVLPHILRQHGVGASRNATRERSEEHTSELPSLMRI